MRAITRGSAFMMRELTQSFQQTNSQRRVYSMSKRWDNFALWSSYANGHTGYCIEFANYGAFYAAQEVMYRNTAVEIDIADADLFPTPDWLYTKTTEWSYEEEVRLVFDDTAPSVITVVPSQITRVLLGKDMPTGDAARVCEWAKRRTPPLQVARTSFNSLTQRLEMSEISSGSSV